jgi:rare lipoprotein A (peptidoglycan hydrolase)
MLLRPVAIAAAIAVTALTAGSVALAQTPAPTGGAAFGDADGLRVTAGALVGKVAKVSGELPAAAGATVRVERQDAAGDWEAIGRGPVDASGAFTVTWTADEPGRFPLRAVPDTTNATTAASTDAPTGTATIYKPTRATWYGMFGRKTACGVRLTRTTMGVAHKTLPCGTMVAVYLDGRTIEVPVLDRGPYAKGVALDLTWAAAQAIGMEGTDRVGWTTLVAPPAPDTDAAAPAPAKTSRTGAARAG